MPAKTSSGGRAIVTTPSDTQILITREFDAPKHLVYKAWTTSELVKRWWSADMGTTTVAQIDLRIGGRWRYVMVTNTGFEILLLCQTTTKALRDMIVQSGMEGGIQKAWDQLEQVAMSLT